MRQLFCTLCQLFGLDNAVTRRAFDEARVLEERAVEAEQSRDADNLELVEGTYMLDVAVHTVEGYPYDYHRLLYTFRVKSRTHDVGIYRPRHQWSFSPHIRFTPRS